MIQDLTLHNNTTWSYKAEEQSFSRIKKVKDNDKINLEITTYTLGKKLGEGSTSNVYNLIPNIPTKKIKAIKIPLTHKDFLSPEFEIMSLLPSAKGVMKPPKGWVIDCIILPKYERRLCDIAETMSSEMKMDAITQLVNGLMELHENGICHGDILSINILFRKKRTLSCYDIVDFGTSRVYGKTVVNFYTSLDSEDQFMELKQYDIHNLGIIFWKLVSTKKTFPETLTREQVCEKGFPPNIADLINYMCDRTLLKKEMSVAYKILTIQ